MNTGQTITTGTAFLGETETEYPIHMFASLPEDAKSFLETLYSMALEKGAVGLTELLIIRDLEKCKQDGEGMAEQNTGFWILLLLLAMSLYEGGLCLHLDEKRMEERLAALFATEEAGPANLPEAGQLRRRVREAREWCRSESAARLVSRIQEEAQRGHKKEKKDRPSPRFPDKPLVLVEADKPEGSRIYFQRYYLHEGMLLGQLADFFTIRLPFWPEAQDKAAVAEAVHFVLAENPLHLPSGDVLTLDADQLKALWLAMYSNFLVISGGPGTGKTALSGVILRVLVRLGIDPRMIALAAPTGKAAKRLEESLRAQEANLADSGPETLSAVEGKTLHRLLHYSRQSGTFRYNEAYPLPYKVIIVDEVSMVDVSLMTAFLRAVDPARTRLILLGDRNQLPSVEAGTVLADLLPEAEEVSLSPASAGELADVLSLPAQPGEVQSGEAQKNGRGENNDSISDFAMQDRAVFLSRSHRSQRKLQELAQAVNKCDPAFVQELDTLTLAWDEHEFRISLDWPAPDSDSGSVFHTDIAKDPRFSASQAMRGVLTSWAERCYQDVMPGQKRSYLELLGECRAHFSFRDMDENFRRFLHELFAVLNSSRVLTLVRNGPYGVSGVNRVLNDFFRNQPRQGNWGHGVPFMVTRNDYQRNLFNGDIGVFLIDRRGIGRIVFPASGGHFAVWEAGVLGGLETAFALTVHKSQGSEFGEVLLIFPEQANRMLSREIVYTGITRARYHVSLVGREAILQKAVTMQANRESGLKLWS